MNDSCRVTVKPLAVRLAYLTALACLAVNSSVYAISFGHSRLLSPVGQPLQIQVPVHALTGQERDSLSVSLAAPSAWQEAGLTPPVDPASMQVAVVDGVRPGSKVITIRSNQPLSTNVADLL
ncbi:MAG: peptidoglycan-binding protein LysM, partial [Pusillimonas sp.]|nr:peptidoglycan-binding protein LysM [Pusillimonas sp.]